MDFGHTSDTMPFFGLLADIGNVGKLHFDPAPRLINSISAYTVSQQFPFERAILLDLESADEELFPKQRRYNRKTASDFLRRISSYLINHYDNLIDLVDKGEPLYDFLYQYAHEIPLLNPAADDLKT